MKFLLFQVALLYFVISLRANPINNDQHEYGDKYQGDIALTKEQEESLKGNGRSGKTGVINTYYRWPKINGRVTVPYVISTVYTSSERTLILNAMSYIQTYTCVSFVPRTNQNDYINIISDSGGCWSHVGRIGGKQDLSLRRSGCINHGIAMHEMIHALGFEHMHQHWDRDSKIIVYWDNIQSNMAQWFNKLNSNSYNNYGTAYDISSVMHYGAYAFSRNGQMTMYAKTSADRAVMGQRSYLSVGDVTRIKSMYQC